MFEILRNADSNTAVDAAYRIGLRISERDRFPTWRKWLPIRPDVQWFPESIAVAARVLEEIEAATGKPLAELSDDEVAPYQRRIRKIMRARSRAEFPDPDGVGERILQELRRDYGPGYRHRAVA
jgi:hypothetical protein